MTNLPATVRPARRWRRRLGTARRLRRTAGVRGVAFLLLQRSAPSPWIHPEWFTVLEHETRASAAGDLDGRVRWGGPGDLPALLAGGRDEATLRARFARGDRVAILDDGEASGYAWYRTGEYDEQGIIFRLGPGEAWGYDGWIAEDARGRGNARRLLRGASRALGAEGVTRVLLSVNNTNGPSLRATRASGRVPIASIWMLRVFGLSVRREAWEGATPRWSVYRGTREATTPARRMGGPAGV